MLLVQLSVLRDDINQYYLRQPTSISDVNVVRTRYLPLFILYSGRAGEESTTLQCGEN